MKKTSARKHCCCKKPTFWCAATPEQAKACIAKGIDLNKNWEGTDDDDPYTPLDIAIRCNDHTEVIKLLIDARVRGGKNCGREVMVHATKRHDNAEVLKLLIAAGEDVNSWDMDGYVPLHTAAVNEDPEYTRALIAAGAKMEVVAFMRWSPPFHAVIMNKNPEVIKLFIEAGIDVNKIVRGSTLLHAALCHMANPDENPNEEMIKTLLAAGADVHARDVYGDTPLHTAAWRGYPKGAQLLLDAGADVHAKNKKGETPLHHLSWGKPFKVMQLLLAAGANVRARNKKRDTPLHLMVRAAGEERKGYPDPQAIQLLLDAGADVYAKNKEGETPLSLAEALKEDHEVAKMIRAAAIS